MNKVLFLVSSAINTSYSKYDKQTRISQTQDTIKSIEKYCNDSDICILDGGKNEVSKIEIDEYFPNITNFYSVCNDDYAKKMHSINNQTYKRIYTFDIQNITKSTVEVYMYLKHFKKMQLESSYKNYSRIFKISGRYKLNENFRLNDHLNAKDKVMILNPKKSELRSVVTYGITEQYMTRLWSFDSSLIPHIVDVYDNMLKNMEYVYPLGGFVDIEHSLYKYLNKDIVNLVPVIGIEGNIAPTGKAVSE